VTKKQNKTPIYTEVHAAWDARARGDFWPEIKLEYKADLSKRFGLRNCLAEMIRTKGLEPNSDAANFVASIIDDSFKRTKHDINVYREYEILAAFGQYELVMLRGDDAEMRTRQDVIERVAREFMPDDGNDHCEAIEQILKRNRKRNRTQS
jgi:hypothetical protein